MARVKTEPVEEKDDWLANLQRSRAVKLMRYCTLTKAAERRLARACDTTPAELRAEARQ